MKRILLLGGTGFVGRHVCAKLAQLSGDALCRVTVPTRRAANAQAIQSLPMVDVVQADVHDEGALARLVAGHDAVVNLVAILHGSQAAFEHAHVALVSKLARACNAAGVQRVVHVSALGAAPDAPSLYLRSKAAGEAVWSASGLGVTTLRPSVIFGADDQFLNLFAKLQAVFPVMPLAGATARFQPVWVEDIAQAIVQCLHSQRSVFDSNPAPIYAGTGPETFTLRQLVELAGRLSGHPRPVLPLGSLLGNLQALAMELAPGPTLMSRDNLRSMQVDNVADGSLPGLQALGITPAALSAIAPGYLSTRNTMDGYRKTSGR